MSIPGQPHSLNRKVVVIFDICSSTTILSDLIATENHRKWADLLIRLKKFLVAHSASHHFDVYKFVGDGYILLFSPLHHGQLLLKFLRELCTYYTNDYIRNIKPLLDRPPSVSGITFGIDRGSLMHLTMQGRPEYIGKALNVASRLQGALKDKDSKPAGKALVTAHYYATMRHELSGWNVTRVKRTLRNIGDDVYCYKINLSENPKLSARRRVPKVERPSR
jgi:class 3 adenylate cyclase